MLAGGTNNQRLLTQELLRTAKWKASRLPCGSAADFEPVDAVVGSVDCVYHFLEILSYSAKEILNRLYD